MAAMGMVLGIGAGSWYRWTVPYGWSEPSDCGSRLVKVSFLRIQSLRMVLVIRLPTSVAGKA
jgi:hypothetical protein